jgi:hypothetical protein
MKCSKQSVAYRVAKSERRCGTCSMFRPNSESCSLVKGYIHEDDTCDRWEAK